MPCYALPCDLPLGASVLLARSQGTERFGGPSFFCRSTGRALYSKGMSNTPKLLVPVFAETADPRKSGPSTTRTDLEQELHLIFDAEKLEAYAAKMNESGVRTPLDGSDWRHFFALDEAANGVIELPDTTVSFEFAEFPRAEYADDHPCASAVLVSGLSERDVRGKWIDYPLELIHVGHSKPVFEAAIRSWWEEEGARRERSRDRLYR